jgi:isochorismate synthase EntC
MPIQSFNAPIINLNGSSPERLIEDIRKALEALNDATVAVALTAPHGRDWQTATDGEMLYRQARADHERRLHSLNVIHSELEAIGLSIQDQADERRR